MLLSPCFLKKTDPPVKILYLSTQQGWHGGEEQLRLLVAGMYQAGHDCRLVVRRGGEFSQRMRAAGYEVVEMAGAMRGVRAFWRVRKVLQEFQPDIVHANDSHALATVNMASSFLWNPTNRPGCIASRRVLFPIRSTYKYHAWCDRVVCVSHAIAEVCRQSGVRENLLRVVHSGINPERAATGDALRGRQSLGLDENALLLLCIAQLAPYKGHRYLLEAMPRVLEKFPHVVLALAGDGPLAGELVDLAKELGVEESVRFLGYRHDVPDLLRACDIFALVSPDEGLGTSVLDAMFAEKPVLGANAGGIPEMLGGLDGEPNVGWLVPPRDAPAIADGLLEAIGSERLRRHYGVAGRRRAQRGFTANDMLRGMQGIYKEVLTERNR